MELNEMGVQVQLNWPESVQLTSNRSILCRTEA